MGSLKNFELKCELMGQSQMFLDALHIMRKECEINDEQVELLKSLRSYFAYAKEGLAIAREKLSSKSWWEEKASEKIERFRFFTDLVFADVKETSTNVDEFEKQFNRQVDVTLLPIDEAIITKHISPASFDDARKILQRLLDHHICLSHSLDGGCF